MGNESSMECADVCSAFSKLLPTLFMGVSDRGVTWKEKTERESQEKNGEFYISKTESSQRPQERALFC